MSGVDNYEITGFLKPKSISIGGGDSTEYDSEWNFPSMPMYQNNSTYNGKCAVWLKSVRVGARNRANRTQVEGLLLREMLEESNFSILMKTASLNQIAINPVYATEGAGEPTLNNGIDYRVSDTRSNAGGYTFANFPFAFNEQHFRFAGSGVANNIGNSTFNADDVTSFSEPKVVVAVGTGAGTAGLAPAVSQPAIAGLIDNAKLFTFYRNGNVGNMEDAVLINAPWGSRVVCGICNTELTKNNVGSYTKAGRNYNMGSVSLEVRFVIKPLKNEAEYSGMPNDEKERR